MKTKFKSLALLISLAVLAQAGAQAQPFQAAPQVVNQHVNPSNPSGTATGTAVQTLPSKNSSSSSLPVNPVAAAASEKAGKEAKSSGSVGSTKCASGCGTGDTCPKNC